MEITELLGKSKQGYYKQINRIEHLEFQETLILEMVKKKRKLWKKGSGRNLHAALREEFKQHGIKLGRDKFFDLLRRNGLLIKPRRKKTSTTNSYHQYHKYPNLIKDLEIKRVNQVLVTDITYLYLRESDSFAYLYLVTDHFSRKILGFNISEDLRASSAVKALKMALRNMSDIDNCIHHSDRGIQYCSKEYTTILHRKSIKISMTENSDPLENAVAERMNKTVKEEFTEEKQISFTNFREAKIIMSQIVKFYNNERPHRTLEFYTPSMAYQMNRELKRKWKNYYKKHETITE